MHGNTERKYLKADGLGSRAEYKIAQGKRNNWEANADNADNTNNAVTISDTRARAGKQFQRSSKKRGQNLADQSI